MLFLFLQGLGTDDRALIRIMVSRSEIDLFNIRKEFKDTHDASLHEFIQVETMVVSVHVLQHCASECVCVRACCVCMNEGVVCKTSCSVHV